MLSRLTFPSFALLGVTYASSIPHALYGGTLLPRAPTNGSCLSAPDDACLSLLGLCVSSIVSGTVPSNAFWSDRVCTAAATCAGMGSVLNAACCAGTCRQPLDIQNLDANVYAAMVGNCGSQPVTNCALTWQPFVDWFYNTIQMTGTNLWPESGDDVLAEWADIATWTAFCEGTNCVDASIPYSNFNDWFHFSAAVDVTTPGTPQYTEPLSTDPATNENNMTPDFTWPCVFDDPGDCGWDYGPPTPPENLTALAVVNSPRRTNPFEDNGPFPPLTANLSAIARSDGYPFGRAEHQPLNVPPPVYVMGEPLTLHLDGPDAYEVPEELDDLLLADESDGIPLDDPLLAANLTDDGSSPVINAITPDRCLGSIDTPTTLPTLTYFCEFLPNICANIRSHSDWPLADSMILTYDPFSASTGRRRRGVCTTAVKARFQTRACDKQQHDPAFWHISCDEFPFNSVLEGGAANAVTEGVPQREQQYQGSLQTSITNLLSRSNRLTTLWKGSTGRRCHRWRLRLLDTTPGSAPANAVGTLSSGSAFFRKKVNNSNTGIRFITDRRRLRPMGHECSHDWNYRTTDRSLRVPSFNKGFDCRPCKIGRTAFNRCTDPFARGKAPTPTSAPAEDLDLAKRQVVPTTCSPTTTTSASTTAEATAVAKDSAAAAAAAMAAAAAAAAAVPAEAAPAAAAAVAAGEALLPAAAALTNPLSDVDWADAFSAAEASLETASDAVSSLWDWIFSDDDDDPVKQVVDQVSEATNSVADAMDTAKDVMNPTVAVPPDLDPAKNPLLNSGPPPDTPPAACFGAGSRGFLKVGDAYVTNANGKAAATLLDAGSNAYFGLNLDPDNRPMVPISGCRGVYSLGVGNPTAQYQVDCSTMEFGVYWNGLKQACYTYDLGGGLFFLICANDLGNAYQCLRGINLNGNLIPAFLNWATS
ncbi:hypothetical protein C8Q76DRAFT_665789 [Earliella scabrosa]|nr:hypothetical protein C8Q76DRAFT_665789 [Earliella scabrosa]